MFRVSGCLPLLIQLLHGNDKDSGLLGNTRGSKQARARAAAALHNLVHSHPDDKRGRREARVLRLLEQIRAHCDQLRDAAGGGAGCSDEDDEEKKHLLSEWSPATSPSPSLFSLCVGKFPCEILLTMMNLADFSESFFLSIFHLIGKMFLQCVDTVRFPRDL